ncbi:hypothetical protein ABPG74_018966 [Tetrahymena malaccensis]
MNNKIILQASKSIEVIKQELQNNSQRTSISIQIQHIRQRQKLYLDLLEDHLNNQQHYQDVQITIAKNTLIGDEGFQMLSQCLKGLKKVQILKLFLGESCQVGSQGLIYLSEAISDLKQLYDLTIILDSYNYVRNEGLVSLASIFSKLPNLVKLQVKIGQSNRYDDLGISVICKNLQLIKQLQYLKFEIDGSKVSKIGAQQIAESLEQLTNLENLDFMIEARLGKVEGAKDLAISLGKLVNLKVLKFSIIQENRICSETSIELYNSLKKLQKLESFLIKGFQHFQDKQTTVCYAKIFEQIPQLKNMNLEIDCPQLQGTYTAYCLANCLQNLTKLTKFDISLSKDSNISDEGFSALAYAIRNMRNLKKLVISIDGNNTIGNAGAFSLGQALGELEQLESIKLFLGNQNEIFSEGATAIAEGIQKMSNLINLGVRINSIKQSNSIEITSFGQILSQLSNLEVLEYQFCSSITNHGAQAFAQGISNLKKLKKLQLNFSIADNLTEENQITFFESFKYLTNLTCLNLQFFNHCEESKIDAFHLSQSLPSLENLIELSLDLCFYFNKLKVYQNVLQFCKSLGYLTKITKLNLNIKLNPSQFMYGQFFNLFFESISIGIKNLILLQDLQLNINSSNLDLQIQPQIFAEMFYSLINLKKLVLLVTSAELVMQIANSLQYLQYLEFLHFDYNMNIEYKQNNEELMCLGKGLCYLTNLHEISLNIYIPQELADFNFKRQNFRENSFCGFGQYNAISSLKQTLYSINEISHGKQQAGFDFVIYNFRQQPRCGNDYYSSISPLKQTIGSIINEIFHGIKSIKNLEKIQATIRSSDGQCINLLDYINSFKNVQNIDLTLGDDSQFDSTKQINNFYPSIKNEIQDNKIQIKNQQNLNYLSLTQLSIQINKMNGQQTYQLENFLRNISFYKNINLFSFIINDNKLFTFQQFQLMCASLSNLSYLRDLTLSFQESNQIGPQSALYLSNAFKSFPELEFLSLQITNLNNINEEGAYHLSKGIKYLTNLRQFKFQLGGCNIQKEGAIQIGECLQCLINLRILFLEIGKDKIESEGAISIGNAIKYLTHLTELKIQIGESNQIQKEGACAFANGMQYLSNLKTLNLVINDSNYIESFGVSVICEALSKMNYLQILNLDFGDNNMIQSSSIQEISNVIKSLNLIKSFRIIINVSKLTSNYYNEVIDMTKLIDPISIIFNCEEDKSKIHHEILPNKQIFQNKNLKIITNFEDSEYIFKSIFLPIESISQIPSVKQLQIKTDKYECKKEWSKLADTFNYIQSLKDLRLYFVENIIGSVELQCVQNLSLLTNLKHLSMDLQKLEYTNRQFLQEMGQQLSQLHNLESFLFIVNNIKLQENSNSLLACLIDYYNQEEDDEKQQTNEFAYFLNDILMDIILQASKSIEVIKQELENNSQRTSISIQIQHIRQRSKQYLDLLAGHLKIQKHYQDVQIRIIQNTLIGDEGFQMLSQCLKCLKKVQILKLFLGESCQAGSQGLIYLSQAISNLKQLSDLQIILDRQNYVRNDGLISLASIFSKLPNLVKLQIKIGQSNRYDDLGISVICKNIKLIKQLQILQFEIDGSRISKFGAQVIAETLEQLTNLENLDFMIEARLGKVERTKDLAIALGKLVNLKVLKFSIIQENRICSEASIELCNSLKKLQKLESFLIKGFQPFQDKQTTICYTEIFEQIPQLKYMNLEIDCPQLQGTFTAFCLANCLKNLTNLTDFEISLCNDSNISDDGLSALSQSVKNMRNLKKLAISIDGNNTIGNTGAYSLGEALGELKQLESIKLFLGNQNEISSQQARTIAEGIQKMSNLINLDVRINRSKQSIEITSFGQILSQLSNLEVLEYQFCSSITNLGAQVFGQGIRSLKKLKKLQLNFSIADNLTEKNQITFFESFKYLTNLTCLNLQFFNFCEKSQIDAFHLSKSLPFLKNLIELSLDLCVNFYNLQNPNAREFGESLGYLTKITKLNLNIQVNPPEFMFQQFFKSFFESIPLGIKNLIQIKDLQFNINSSSLDLQIQPQIFADMFQNLINLKKLVLQVTSTKMVMQIANSLQYLKHLEFLHFDISLDSSQNPHQELNCLGKGLCNLINLHEISLHINICISPTPILPLIAIRRQRNDFLQNYCVHQSAPLKQIPDLNFNEFISGIKSIKNLEKFQTTITSTNGQSINLLDCINIFENVQNIDLTLGEDTLSDTKRQIKNWEAMMQNQIYDNKKQLKNQQNLNYLSLTQLSISIYKMNYQQTDMLGNFVNTISRYKNIISFSFIVKDSFLFTFQQFQLMCASLSNLSYLRDLTLSFQENNEIGPQSAVYLANAFKGMPELELLSLQIANLNYINEEGAYHLSKGIKSLTNLRQFKFQLGGCNIQKEGAIQIGECLQRLINLRILILEIEKDKIESEGAISIGNAIKYLTHLTELTIQIGESNQILKEGACAFANGMQYLSNLKTLNLVINDSNKIESFGVSAICEALSKMNYLQILNLDFGCNNFIQSSSIQEISQVIKSLNHIQNFRIIINVSKFTSNYYNEVIDMIKLIDPIIYIFKSIFLPIESISQIPSVKWLQIKTDKYVDVCKKQSSKQANIFNHLQSLEDLRIYFFENGIGSFFESGKNLSQLTNLKHLTLNLLISDYTKEQLIQEIGQQLSQLHNLESFQILVLELSALESNELLFLIKCISILQKLNFVKIIQDRNHNKIFQRNLLNQIARKARRLVVFKVEI